MYFAREVSESPPDTELKMTFCVNTEKVVKSIGVKCTNSLLEVYLGPYQTSMIEGVFGK